MQRLICAGRHRSLESYALVLLLSAGLVIGCASAEAVSSDSVPEKQTEIVRVKLSGLNASAVPAGKHIFDSAERWADFWSRYHKNPAPVTQRNRGATSQLLPFSSGKSRIPAIRSG